MKQRVLMTALAVLLAATPVLAGVQSAGFKVTTTAEKGALRLPGVAVAILDSQGKQVATLDSGEEGQLSVPSLPVGRYTIVAKLSGFREVRRIIDVRPGAMPELNLDLEAELNETVSVVVKEADAGFASSLASREVLGARTAEQLPIGGESIQAALRVISSVTSQTAGVRIKGGRADQTSLQLGPVSVNDPTGGAGLFRLPVDAIDGIDVMPNPYDAEYGGFSSGLVVVRPRTPPDKWTIIPNGWPSFLTTRENPFHPIALREFTPRVVFGGPVRPGVSLMVSALARYSSEQVWSRPITERRNTTSGSLFTRLDARASERHQLSATFGWFPADTEQADLNTFIGPEASVNQQQRAITSALADTFQIRPGIALEGTLAVQHFSSGSRGRGTATMVVTPDEILGNFYNDQDRQATTVQLREVFSAVSKGSLGQHLFKAGIDAVYTDYAETNTNRPIEVRRMDGTLAEVVAFDALSRRQSRTTDAAAFVGDWWQVHPRLLLEGGTRLEYSGAFEAMTFAPRAAATFALRTDGTAALRGGIGIFPDRLPSAVDAFGQLGARTETRYAADGVTPLGPPIVLFHALDADLKTPRSQTWNLEYDQHLTRRLSVRANYLERRGSNELIVNPTDQALLLSTSGRSLYREAEFAARYTHEGVIDLSASYTRSRSEGNLNGYALFYGLKPNPFVRPDVYAPADVNAPNRFLMWTTITAVPDWLFGVVGSVRNGFPYSAVNEYLDYVGPRNDGLAFPTAVSVDFSVEWHVKFDRLARKLGPLGTLRPWIGFTLFNALNANLPIDVQSNLGSGNFGTFYNSPQRQFRISLRFRR
ncbi:MAG TPA: TonB-dependent receptor [Vicinamibacterales bacterium]|nr:TonB-dependent receptor [Vicinamibacterales bacterium]